MMKQILLMSLLFVLIACSSKTGSLTSEMEPFMNKNFPNAKFEVSVNNKLHQLIIVDKGNVMNQENYEPIAIRTFSEFYKAFVTGLIACTWMISIVKKSKLSYFSIYCFIVGTLAIIWSMV